MYTPERILELSESKIPGIISSIEELIALEDEVLADIHVLTAYLKARGEIEGSEGMIETADFIFDQWHDAPEPKRALDYEAVIDRVYEVAPEMF